MNPFVGFFSIVGMPLGAVVIAVLSVLGVFKKKEGFEDLARWIGVCYYSGIATFGGVGIIFVWLIWLARG